MDADRAESCRLAAAALKRATNVLVMAGAGASADSELSTYTGAGAFSQWRRARDGADLFAVNDTTYTKLASAEIYEENPALAWGFDVASRKLYWEAKPHEGYSILRDILAGKDAFVCTSNVDGFFARAGFDSAKLCELHGSNLDAARDCRAVWAVDTASNARIVCDAETGCVLEVPQCAQCGQVARPNVCLFRDMLWQAERYREQQQRLEQWLESHKEGGGSAVVLEIGAGRAISTVRQWGEKAARTLGATLVRINLEDCATAAPDDGGIGIAMGALAALQQLRDELAVLAQKESCVDGICLLRP